jgi:hypothetical protein
MKKKKTVKERYAPYKIRKGTPQQEANIAKMLENFAAKRKSN